MAKVKSEKPTKKSRPALTPEARENQMIALAVDAAEEQLRNGTASSQVITHYLKLATTKSRLEVEKLRKETELLEAKRKSIESMENQDQMYKEAIEAMRTYSGNGNPEDYEEYDDY